MLKKTLIVSGAALALAFASSVFAQTAGNTAVPPTNTTTAKIACVGAAVATRETAIDAAVNTHGQAVNTAYTTRATALGQAYHLTTIKAVNTAVRAAWSAFNSTLRTARRAWQASRDSAWKQFRTSAAACKAPLGVGDHANASLEASGN